MVFTQKIGEVKFHVNNYGELFDQEMRKKIYDEFEKIFKAKYEYSEYKKALYFECTYSQKGDLIISLQMNILYSGIYQTTLNYKFIYPFLLKVIEELKNINICVGSYSTKIATSVLNLTSVNDLKIVIEKSGAFIMRENNEDLFTLYQSEDEALSSVSKNIKENFHFLNCHRKTNFHEIDPKVKEARLCIGYGLNNASIIMIIIALEEALKTILKYDYYKNNSVTNTGQSLEEIKELTKKAQKKYGSLPLSKCIINASKNNLITNDEESILKEINEKLRSAQFHSDKSKMFSNDETEITLLKSNPKSINQIESKQMSANDLIFIQGHLQFYLADKNAKDIFNEIEELIYNISTRYKQNNKKLID